MKVIIDKLTPNLHTSRRATKNSDGNDLVHNAKCNAHKLLDKNTNLKEIRQLKTRPTE